MKLKLEELSVRQKLGMVFCARRFGEEDIAFTIKMIKEHALGCIQLPAHQKDVIERILKEADYPILVFNDTEQGFPTTDLPKSTPMNLAACGKRAYVEAFAKGIVRDAKNAGYNGTWGPVVDILDEDGPCKVYRCFSDKPDKVAELTEIIAEIYRQNRYLSTGKHYPGSIGCPFDTHMTEGKSYATKEELIAYSLKPYMHLHKKGLLPCIMTGHTIFPEIDPDYPASLSKKVIDIIRDLGFDGLTFTDSFAMMGILQKYGEENVYGMAIAAGNDIVLPNFRHSTEECFEMLVKNYEDGIFSEERLNEAVRRVLAAQDYISEKPENPTEFTEEDEKLLHNISKDCITAVTDAGVSAALDNPESADRLFIIVTENCFDETMDNPETDTASWYHPERMAKKIREEFPNAGIEFIPEFSGQKDHDRVLTAATNYKEVVFITFCTTTSYLGTDCLTKRTEVVLNCLIHSQKVSTIVHFGNPHALKTISHVPRRLFGYMMTDTQVHIVDVLKGTLEAKGVLPYEVELQ